jgi:hypothetical protein
VDELSDMGSNLAARLEAIFKEKVHKLKGKRDVCIPQIQGGVTEGITLLWK